jgi:hypothetical protein
LCLTICYSRNINFKIHRTAILPVVLYECETQIKGGKLSVLEKRGETKRIFGTKRDEEQGSGTMCIKRSLTMIRGPHQLLFGRLNPEEGS